MAPSALLASSSASPVRSLRLAAFPELSTGIGVSGVLVRVLVGVAEERGVAREVLLREVGLDLACIQDFDARVDLYQFQRLFLHAIRLTGDPAFGLHFGVQSSELGFDLVGHLIAHATTLRQAISACRQFQPLFMDDAQLHFSERAGTAQVRCTLPRSDASFDPSFSEFALAGLMRLLRSFGGAKVQAHAVYFEHPRPGHHLECSRVFGGVDRYRQAFTGIDFSTELLDRPHLHSHPELHAVLRVQAERSLDRLSRPQTFQERLHSFFLAQSPSSCPDMRIAARELGLSIRSLRRRLAEEGVSYRELAQNTLKERACQLLRDPECSVQETAHALGFADATAFHRAFKRWTGVTPLNFRESRPSIAAG